MFRLKNCDHFFSLTDHLNSGRRFPEIGITAILLRKIIENRGGTTMRRHALLPILLASLIFGVYVPAAQAVLTLTMDGINDGFILTTFVSGYNFNGNYGPLAQGIAPNGQVITASVGDAKIYVFNDVDNQTLASAVSATTYTFTTVNPNYAMTTAGGQVYGAQLQGAHYEQFNSNGTHSVIPVLSVTTPVV